MRVSAAFTEEKVFRFLEGEWVVRRHFEGSCGGAFSGKASFAPKADSVSSYQYTEQGELTDSEGKTFDAKQSYRYRLEDRTLQVLKREASDWIVMHELEFDLKDGIATAQHVHLCGEDHYATVYRVDFSGTFEITYSVSGPKKDYRIRSVFSQIRFASQENF